MTDIRPEDFEPFIAANDPATIERFEAHFGMSQAEAVDAVIEYSEDPAHVPYHYQKGTPEQRRRAVIQVFKKQRKTIGTSKRTQR